MPKVVTQDDFQTEAQEVSPIDIATLQAALHAAEAAQAAALSKREQLSKVRNGLNHQIARLNLTLREKRIASYEAVADEHPANHKKLCEEIRVLTAQRDEARQALSYITSFRLAQAEITLKTAEADEREATARVLARQALDARKASLTAASAAKAEDPGIVISFGAARSQGLLEQSKQAQYTCDRFREQVIEMKKAMANEQGLAAPGLFNS
jgi:hypothetical protein